jgi:hypothetical protein
VTTHFVSTARDGSRWLADLERRAAELERELFEAREQLQFELGRDLARFDDCAQPATLQSGLPLPAAPRPGPRSRPAPRPRTWPSAPAEEIGHAAAVIPGIPPRPGPRSRPAPRPRTWPSAPAEEIGHAAAVTHRVYRPRPAETVDQCPPLGLGNTARQDTLVMSSAQRKKPTDSVNRRRIAVRIAGLSALFGAVNAPLFMANPPATVIAAPATNLAAAAFVNSMSGNKKQPSYYFLALAALQRSVLAESARRRLSDP